VISFFKRARVVVFLEGRRLAVPTSRSLSMAFCCGGCLIPRAFFQEIKTFCGGV
jgi:hypothetical protein